MVECRTPEWEVGGSKPTAAVLCPWARHFTPQKYRLITQEAVAPSQHDWKIVDWDVKPQHKKTNKIYVGQWPIFHGTMILPYICKTIWWMKIILDIMDQCDTKIDHIKYIGQWPTSHGPVILPYILKTIWLMKVILWLMDQCDTKVVLIKYM